MSPPGHADAAFAPGAPFLPVPELPFLLLASAFRALGGTVGNAHALDAFGFCRDFVLARVESGRPPPTTMGRGRAPPDAHRLPAPTGLCRRAADHRLQNQSRSDFRLPGTSPSLPNSLGLPDLPLRMISVEGSNTLTNLPSDRVSTNVPVTSTPGGSGTSCAVS
jgi:hypothetical protein